MLLYLNTPLSRYQAQKTKMGISVHSRRSGRILLTKKNNKQLSTDCTLLACLETVYLDVVNMVNPRQSLVPPTIPSPGYPASYGPVLPVHGSLQRSSWRRPEVMSNHAKKKTQAGHIFGRHTHQHIQHSVMVFQWETKKVYLEVCI